jgi:hypothetical protein
LFTRCEKLKVVMLTGCKNLTEKCLPQISELYKERKFVPENKKQKEDQVFNVEEYSNY